MHNVPVISGPSNNYFDEKQYHDEDESMAEYGNGENGKFNDDGSFIGLYGRERVQTYVVQYNQNQPNNPAVSSKEAGDGTKPHSTFVWSTYLYIVFWFEYKFIEETCFYL